MIETLLKIFHSYTRSLEILYLLEDIKPAVRLKVYRNKLQEVKDFCRREGLCLEISDKIVGLDDNGRSKSSDPTEIYYSGSPMSDLYCAYISKSSKIAKLLKSIDFKNKDKAIGKLLGYPECCINFFLQQLLQDQTQENYVLPVLNNSESYKFPFYTNFAPTFFDVSLLSHFPHNFYCKESIIIAKKNLSCLRKYSKKLAAEFIRTLKSAVLYTKRGGIFLLEDYDFKDGILKFHTMRATNVNEQYNFLNKCKTIRIINKNEIWIDNYILKDIGIMLFS